jgi:hypothetical protein
MFKTICQAVGGIMIAVFMFFVWAIIRVSSIESRKEEEDICHGI